MATDERPQQHMMTKANRGKQALADDEDRPWQPTTWAGALARTLELVASGWGAMVRVCIFLVVATGGWWLTHGR